MRKRPAGAIHLRDTEESLCAPESQRADLGGLGQAHEFCGPTGERKGAFELGVLRDAQTWELGRNEPMLTQVLYQSAAPQ